MGFGIKTSDLPSIYTYENALRRYKTTPPIKGTTIRPLGDRRAKHKSISLTSLDAVACELYGTHCVVYYPDGSLHLRHGGHVTKSTADFISRIAPVSDVYVERDCLIVRVAGGEYKCGNEGLRLTRGSDGYKPVEAKPFTVTKLDRKAMNEMRKKYKPFIQYVINMGKITDFERPDHRGSRFEYLLHSQEEFLRVAEQENLDEWAELVPLVIAQAGTVKDNYVYNQGWSHVWICNEARVKAFIDQTIKKAHASKLFFLEKLEPGVYKKDTNRKYVRGVQLDERLG